MDEFEIGEFVRRAKMAVALYEKNAKLQERVSEILAYLDKLWQKTKDQPLVSRNAYDKLDDALGNLFKAAFLDKYPYFAATIYLPGESAMPVMYKDAVIVSVNVHVGGDRKGPRIEPANFIINKPECGLTFQGKKFSLR